MYRPVSKSVPGVVVVIHGGFWLAEYDLTYGAPLAADLARRGFTALNVEYRRVGNGGGWPATLLDVAAATDMLAALRVDTSSVVIIGHSAGGQLAAWAAGRSRLPSGAPGAHPRVTASAVISQAGVLDLRAAQHQGLGSDAVAQFLGGTVDEVPHRYRVADPIEQVPAPVPVFCVHAHGDQVVPFGQSERYVRAATAAGGRASLIPVDGDHFTLIDPRSAAWLAVVRRLPALMTGR